MVQGARRSGRVIVAAVAIMLATAATGRAQAPQEVTAAIDGNTIAGVYDATDNPAFVFGVDMSDDLKANVVSIACDPPSRSDPTGGPNGAPECLFPSPVARTNFLIIGKDPWPAEMSVSPFTSVDNATYIIDEPVVIRSAAPTPPPPASESASNPAVPPPIQSEEAAPVAPEPQVVASSDDGGTSYRWLWGLLVVVGVAISATGLALKKPEDDHPHTVEREGTYVPVVVPTNDNYEEPPPMADDIVIRQQWIDMAQERWTEAMLDDMAQHPHAPPTSVALRPDEITTLQRDIANLKQQKANLYTWQSTDPNEFTPAAGFFISVVSNPMTMATNFLGNKSQKIDNMIKWREELLAAGSKSADPIAADKAALQADLVLQQADRGAFVAVLPECLHWYGGEWWDWTHGDPIAKDLDRIETRDVIALDPRLPTCGCRRTTCATSTKTATC